MYHIIVCRTWGFQISWKY